MGVIIREAIKHAHLLPEVVRWFAGLFKKKDKPKALIGLPKALTT